MTSTVVELNLYEQLMASATKIGKIAEAEALEADKNATVSQNVINAIREEQIHRLLLPKEYGFPQIDFWTYADLIKKVSYYNSSAG